MVTKPAEEHRVSQLTTSQQKTRSIFGHKLGSPARSQRLLFALLGIAAIGLAWSILGIFLGAGRFPVLSAPWTVFKSGWSIRSQLSADTLASLKEAFGGWVLGSVAAIVLAVLAGQFRFFEHLIMPVIELLRPISPIAWAPLGIIWFGANYTGKVFLVSLVCFFFVIVHALEGTLRRDPVLSQARSMLMMGRIRTLFMIDLPEAVPQILIGLRLAIAGAWGGMVVAEIVGGQGSAGIGSLELFAEQAVNLPEILFGIVLIAILGYLSSMIFDKVSHLVFPWAPEARGDIVD